MKPLYWARIGNRSVGPHTLKELHELAGFGPETLVCPAGEAIWRKAEEYEPIKAVLEAGSEDEVEEILMSSREKRRRDARRRRMQEKENFKREERKRQEEERQEKLKAMSSAEGGFNPMWLVFLLLVGGLGYAGYKSWKANQVEEVEIPKADPLPHPEREQHWTWKLLGKSEADVIAEFGKESVEGLAPDGSARFQQGGDLGRWSRYERVAILIPRAAAPYGADIGVGTVAFREGKARGVGRRFEAEDPEDLPKLADALPASFANDLAPRIENETTWRLKWEIGRENWGALVVENPGEGPKDWRVQELWLTVPE
jgi:hypothetical protein